MNKERFKNPWFWVGIGGVILTATGMEPSMFTSWDALSGAVLDVLKNPSCWGQRLWRFWVFLWSRQQKV